MSKSKTFSVLAMAIILLLSGCSAHKTAVADNNASNTNQLVRSDTPASSADKKVIAMNLMIDNAVVPVIWEQNASTEELKKMLPLTINMSMYGGFEQVGSIGHSLTRNDKQTTTQCGDIVLYAGDKIVIFYGSNSWSYTRLGHIDLSQSEMTDLLSHGNVTIRITEK